MADLTLGELNHLIKEVRHWHELRGKIMDRRCQDSTRKPLEMGTLPRVILALEAYRDYINARENTP